MYITNTTEKVRKLIEELETKNDITKLKFLIYIFGLLNNNQINNTNEVNPNLVDIEDMKVFSLETIGLSPNAGTIVLQYFVMLYNGITNTNEAYEENGNVLGINHNKIDTQIISKFEKLEFNEKLDAFSEIIIRYDNETYFNERFMTLNSDPKLNGFDLAKMIQNYKTVN